MTTFKELGVFLKILVEQLNIFGKIGKILEKVHKIEEIIEKSNDFLGRFKRSVS